MMNKMKHSIKHSLKKLQDLPEEKLLTRRFERIMSYGKFNEET
jgi:acetyl-CoA carboxylase alpha subunit